MVNAKNTWAKFDGTKLHETQPFQGERISLIAFTHNACEELQADLVAELRGLGFGAGGYQTAHLL